MNTHIKRTRVPKAYDLSPAVERPQRVAVYLRECALDAPNVDIQQIDVVRFCTTNNWQIIKPFWDENSRACFSHLTDPRVGTLYDAVVCWSPAVWSQNLQEALNSTDLLAKVGVRFVCVGKPLDTVVANGYVNFARNVQFIMAEYAHNCGAGKA